MPKINTYTDNTTIEDVDALLTYDPAGNGATKLTTFARIASWISAKLSALTKKTSIASTDQILMVDGAASPVVTKRIDYNVLAKAIIEQYASSSLAGANQSVKTAIDALNSNINGANETAVSNILQWAVSVNGFATCKTNGDTTNLPSGANKYGLAFCVGWSQGSNVWIRVLWFPTSSNDIYVNSKTNNIEWVGWAKIY